MNTVFHQQTYLLVWVKYTKGKLKKNPPTGLPDVSGKVYRIQHFHQSILDNGFSKEYKIQHFYQITLPDGFGKVHEKFLPVTDPLDILG